MSKKMQKKFDPLQKKIPINPKYKNVKPTVDTGASLSKQLQKIEDLKLNYKFSKDEIFKRMKITTFVQLLVQVFHLENDDLEPPEFPPCEGSDLRRFGNSNSAADLKANSRETNNNNSSSNIQPGMDRSTLLGVAQGIGEMEFKEHQQLQQQHQQTVTANHNNNKSQLIMSEGRSYSNNRDLCPYLLLDVRDKDVYDKYRIIPAFNFPKAMLSRSVNYESKEMLAFKNKEGKIIVLYDDDESIVPKVATTLVQRGYDNIFMLSGGLKMAHKIFPEGLITGTIPPSLISSKDGETSKRHHPPNGVPANNSTPLKQAMERGDVDKLEIILTNLMRTSVTSGSSIISGRSSKSTISLRSGLTSNRSLSTRSSSVNLEGKRPAFRP